jgi:hypothetical protein
VNASVLMIALLVWTVAVTGIACALTSTIMAARNHRAAVAAHDAKSVRVDEWLYSDHTAPVALRGSAMIRDERTRQVTKEGWTAEHDDAEAAGELIDAGLSYVYAAINTGHPAFINPPKEWPWDSASWKPSPDRIRNLVKAGALFAAEIDRLIRAEKARES